MFSFKNFIKIMTVALLLSFASYDANAASDGLRETQDGLEAEIVGKDGKVVGTVNLKTGEKKSTTAAPAAKTNSTPKTKSNVKQTSAAKTSIGVVSEDGQTITSSEASRPTTDAEYVEHQTTGTVALPTVTTGGGQVLIKETKTTASGGGKSRSLVYATEDRCSDVTNVFDALTCKAVTTLADLRNLIYVLGGFGMIAFTFAAIFGKISWKHLANIGIGLFLVAMMAPFIEYFTTNNPAAHPLKFGQYLPSNYEKIEGSNDLIADREPADPKEAPSDKEVAVSAKATEEAKKEKWGLKDLKGSVEAGINVARNAKQAVDTAKAVKSNIEQNVHAIQGAIKNNPGGMAGFVDTLANVDAASRAIMTTSVSGVGAIATNTVQASNSWQDMKSTNQQRFDNQVSRSKGEQTNSVASWVRDDSKDGKVTGKTVLDGTNRAGNMAVNMSEGVGKATGAMHTGSGVMGGYGSAGGDVLGAIFGAATLAGETTNTIYGQQDADKRVQEAEIQKAKEQQQMQSVQAGINKQQAYKDQLAKDAAAANQPKSSASNVKVESDGRLALTGNFGEGAKDYKATPNADGTYSVAVKDGQSVIVDKNGSQLKKVDKDGKVVETYAKSKIGETIKYQEDGKKMVLTGKEIYVNGSSSTEVVGTKNRDGTYSFSVGGQTLITDAKGNKLRLVDSAGKTVTTYNAGIKEEDNKPKAMSTTPTSSAPSMPKLEIKK